jgi:hypothetical protein
MDPPFLNLASSAMHDPLVGDMYAGTFVSSDSMLPVSLGAMCRSGRILVRKTAGERAMTKPATCQSPLPERYLTTVKMKGIMDPSNSSESLHRPGAAWWGCGPSSFKSEQTLPEYEIQPVDMSSCTITIAAAMLYIPALLYKAP